MYQLTIPGIPLPKLYVVSTNSDIELCRSNSLPFIIWRGKRENLIKLVMYPYLVKMFPEIKWRQVLGITPAQRQLFVEDPGGYTIEFGEVDIEHDLAGEDDDPNVSSIAEDYRTFDGTCHNEEANRSLDAWVGDLSSYVNIETLQELNLLPAFMGEIADAIRKNIGQAMAWHSGYNKKTRMYEGNWKDEGVLPNLIILDISGSIPRGIAATMISLIETLRDNCEAELIITASHSQYWAANEPLPDPKQIRAMFGYGNESYDFMNILEQKIAGREFGHVISFGDNDSPIMYEAWSRREHPDQEHYEDFIKKMSSTRVHALHNYHTKYADTCTGYLKWAKEICPDAEWHSSSDWCKIMKE